MDEKNRKVYIQYSDIKSREILTFLKIDESGEYYA
jgi:hypothetical protein